MSFLHEVRGMRGFGMPEPHGLVCTCGDVVPMEHWEKHIAIRTAHRWDASGQVLEWKLDLMTTLSNQLLEAIRDYTTRHGRSPEGVHLHADSYKTLIGEQRAMDLMEFRTDAQPQSPMYGFFAGTAIQVRFASIEKGQALLGTQRALAAWSPH